MKQELGPEARALLARARHSNAPSMTDRWTVRRNLAARLSATGVVLTAGVTTTKASATLLGAAKLSLLSQFGIATVAGATLATSAMLAPTYVPSLRAFLNPPAASAPFSAAPNRARSSAQPAMPSLADAPASTAMSALAPEPEPEPMPPSTPAPATPQRDSVSMDGDMARTKTSPPVSGVMREVRPVAARPERTVTERELPHIVRGRLLDEGRALARVQNALSEHRGAEALRLLEEQSQQFVSGALAPERAAARVIALCEVGRHVEARSAAERFAQSWPDSPLVGRALETCKSR